MESFQCIPWCWFIGWSRGLSRKSGARPKRIEPEQDDANAMGYGQICCNTAGTSRSKLLFRHICPSDLTFCVQLLQYYIHRYILHAKRSPLAKLHKSWQHSIPAPFSLVATYDHPLSYLIHRWIPLYVPAIAMRIHILPFLFALSIINIEELMTYSGYSIMPSGILLPGMARRNDNHFLSKGEGNFASFGVIDWVSGTAIGGDAIDDMKAEWTKHGGEQKLIDAGDSAGNFVDNMSEKLKKKGGRKRTVAK
jgi:hypothetical protein